MGYVEPTDIDAMACLQANDKFPLTQNWCANSGNFSSGILTQRRRDARSLVTYLLF